MESKNKQAGMPSDKQIKAKAKNYAQSLKTTNEGYFIAKEAAISCMMWMRDNFCPPSKSEAEVEEIALLFDEWTMEEGFIRDPFPNKHTGIVMYTRLGVENTKLTPHQVWDIFSKTPKVSRLLSAPSKGKYSEWISVEKEKPANKQIVLAWANGYKYPRRLKFYAADEYNREMFVPDDGDETPTHWMPLPEAPESSNPQK